MSMADRLLKKLDESADGEIWERFEDPSAGTVTIHKIAFREQYALQEDSDEEILKCLNCEGDFKDILNGKMGAK